MIYDTDLRDRIRSNGKISEDLKNVAEKIIERALAHTVTIESNPGGSRDNDQEVINLNLSTCFSCSGVAVWAGKNLIFPLRREGPAPNPDMPATAIADFEEARTILNASPRGAAALLRLAAQRICNHLGDSKLTINDNIAEFVRKGLAPELQQSLDAVRVIGNEAVHPGTLDLKDDRDTALALFEILNEIAARMISHPKKVQSIYAMIPPSKVRGIANRDK